MKIDVEIKNKQELLNSLNRELGSVSKQITERHSQNLLDSKTGELAQIERKIIEAKSQLVEVLATQEIHKKNLSNDKAIHESHISGLKQFTQEIELAISSREQKQKDLDGEIVRAMEKLQSIGFEIEKASALLEEKQREVITEKSSLEFIINQIPSARRELDGLNDLNAISRAQFQKDIDDLTTKKRELENVIFAKQSSMVDFQENKKKMEEDLNRKQADLIILENRLRKALEGASVPFKL